MQELTENEISNVDGGVGPYLIIGVVFTAVAISDAVNDFARGYRDAAAN